MRCYLCHTTLLFQNANHFHVTVIFLYRRYPNLVTSLQYKELKMILWDHQHSSLKFRTLKNNFIILAVENSLELEREMTSRFAEGIDSSLLSLQEVPSFSYLGMFAGPCREFGECLPVIRVLGGVLSSQNWLRRLAAHEAQRVGEAAHNRQHVPGVGWRTALVSTAPGGAGSLCPRVRVWVMGMRTTGPRPPPTPRRG